MSDTWQPPPLPETTTHRADWLDWYQFHDAEDPLPQSWDSEPPDTITAYFTAEQLRAYGAASFRAGMEEAASIASSMTGIDMDDDPSDAISMAIRRAAIRKEAGNG
jgi:hypothetical protein